MQVDDRTVEAEHMTLEEAILLYRRKNTSQTLAMICPVREGEIGAGRLLDRATLETTLRALDGKDGKRSVLPPHILWLDAARMVWHVPACRRRIWFGHARDKELEPLNGQEVAHPALLLMASPSGDGPGRFSVWALATDKRPTSDTPVYRSPYFNIFSAGGMCTGNIRMPDRIGPEMCAKWEAALYDTNFTHNASGGSKLTRFRGGHNALWQAMREAKRFPASALLPFEQNKKHLTVGEAIAL